MTLGSLPIGARLLIRSKIDWRSAVVSSFDEEKATLIVCSPTGRTYRLRRLLGAVIMARKFYQIRFSLVKFNI